MAVQELRAAIPVQLVHTQLLAGGEPGGLTDATMQRWLTARKVWRRRAQMHVRCCAALWRCAYCVGEAEEWLTQPTTLHLAPPNHTPFHR